MGHLNVEIKARCADQDAVREILKSKSADFKGVDRQIDTYYKVARGRLKLREGNIENYLVYYDRENKEGPKESNVILFRHDPDSTLKDILTSFVEIEAIDTDGSIGSEKLHAQCRDYMELLGIAEDDLVSVSYSDLVVNAA